MADDRRAIRTRAKATANVAERFVLHLAQWDAKQSCLRTVAIADLVGDDFETRTAMIFRGPRSA